ncbi:hypothetical protein B0H14DRAFT_3493162 [Mycena olivaceomarginata]|nr:hypothetical protein B0H14DRAFT_3493162 [Mycena olivaceomarginata]
MASSQQIPPLLPREPSGGKYQGIFSLVHHSKSTILSTIHTLDLHFSHQILLVDKAEMGLFSQSFNLVCLSIHVHEDWDSSLQSLVSILGTTIPTISWLILSFRTLSSSGIVEVMTCFPGLKELGLNGNDIQTSDDAIPACRLPPRIHALRLSISTMEPVTWMDVGRPLPTCTEVASTDSADYGRPRSTDLDPGKQTLPT